MFVVLIYIQYCYYVIVIDVFVFVRLSYFVLYKCMFVDKCLLSVLIHR